MVALFQFLCKRIAYPDWCQLSIEPEEKEGDYYTYREELMTLYVNLCLIKPLHSTILKMLFDRIEETSLG